MRILRVLWARVRGVFAGSSADAEMREEFESHLAMHVDENIRRGMNPDEARREALIAAGGMTVASEAVRAQRGLPWFESLTSDLRYVTRTLWLNKAYSIAVILTVALGIGANAAMFTIINAVLLRPLPFADPDRLISVSIKNKDGDMGVVDEHFFFAWEREAKSVRVTIGVGTRRVFGFPTGAEQVRGVRVSASYFSVMGERPQLGRVFTADEDSEGGPSVMVLSDQLWRRSFGADPAILGKTITVDDRPATIVGVMPAAYATPTTSQYWIPYKVVPSARGHTFYYFVTARLQPGYTMNAALAELSAISARVAAREGLKDVAPLVMTLHERRFGEAQRPLALLFAAVGVLLLIACANLANLALARAARREREFVVRLALGASRWRVMRHVLSESLILSITGAAAGLGLSVLTVRYFVRLSPASVANVETIHMDGRVIAFTSIVAVLTGLLFGLLPANAAARGDFSRVLSSGSSRLAGSLKQQWLRRVLVVGQLATALMLLTGAGIVARTFWHVTAIDLGVVPERLLTINVALPDTKYSDAATAAFNRDLRDRLTRESGVQAITFAEGLPLSGAMTVSRSDSSGRQTARLDLVKADGGFFETIGAHRVAGRFFNNDDVRDKAKVVVINETAARALFHDSSAIGRKLWYQDRIVIGVVKDIRQRQLERATVPTAYVPLPPAEQGRYPELAIRTSGKAEALEDRIRRDVAAIDPTLAPMFETMEAKVASEVAPRRFTFMLLGMFAMLAATLAVVGLYGVVSFLVAERTREIGIRVALGADAARVRRFVIAQGMGLTLFGVAIGVGVSVFGARALQSLVFETSVHDPRAFVASAALLVGVALLACYVPARRASRVDPILALRSE